MTTFSMAEVRFQVLGLCLLTVSAGSVASAQSCVGHPVAVQILGSGGPWIKADRASTSYLVWVDEHAKLLIDMGGGAFLRFGQSQAKLGDLSMIAISHLHPDHVSDLPALLWLSQLIRQESLPISGPSGNDQAPDFAMFLSRLFDEKNGAFPALGSTLGGGQGRPAPGVRLAVSVVDVTKPDPTKVLDATGMVVTALGIPHGGFPTLAYRVQTRNVSIVFSSDQTGTDPRFTAFAKGANVLIMHMTIEAGTSSPLHASPSVVGQIARDAAVGRLIVSHLGEFHPDRAIAEVKKSYAGPLIVGADLQCTPVQ